MVRGYTGVRGLGYSGPGYSGPGSGLTAPWPAPILRSRIAFLDDSEDRGHLMADASQVVYRALKWSGLLVGFVLGLLSLMVVMATLMDALWLHVVLALVLGIVLPVVISAMVMGRVDGEGRELVGDVYALTWLGIAALVLGVFGGLLSTTLHREADRLGVMGRPLRWFARPLPKPEVPPKPSAAAKRTPTPKRYRVTAQSLFLRSVSAGQFSRISFIAEVGLLAGLFDRSALEVWGGQLRAKAHKLLQEIRARFALPAGQLVLGRLPRSLRRLGPRAKPKASIRICQAR